MQALHAQTIPSGRCRTAASSKPSAALCYSSSRALQPPRLMSTAVPCADHARYPARICSEPRRWLSELCRTCARRRAPRSISALAPRTLSDPAIPKQSEEPKVRAAILGANPSHERRGGVRYTVTTGRGAFSFLASEETFAARVIALSLLISFRCSSSPCGNEGETGRRREETRERESKSRARAHAHTTIRTLGRKREITM